mmetsp:Transcript_3284/g.2839  ORF Transcript_3284/g.2839 Transcript_3284/m.2839 type:complete len:119 (-) Transcript_3284:574-930(-)
MIVEGKPLLDRLSTTLSGRGTDNVLVNNYFASPTRNSTTISSTLNSGTRGRVSTTLKGFSTDLVGKRSRRLHDILVHGFQKLLSNGLVQGERTKNAKRSITEYFQALRSLINDFEIKH